MVINYFNTRSYKFWLLNANDIAKYDIHNKLFLVAD